MAEYVEYKEEKRKIKVKNMTVRSFVLPLIIINIVMFMFQMMIPSFESWFILNSGDILSRPWTLVTYLFLHDTGGFSHLFFNMYALFLFGFLLESKIGPKRFIGLYLISGILVGILASFYYNRFLEPTALLGASGAIMAIIGTTIVLLPKLKLLFFFIIPMDLWMIGVLFFLLDFYGMFVPSNVSNIGHLIGMMIGLAYGFYLYNQRKRFYKKFNKKKTISVKDGHEFEKQYK